MLSKHREKGNRKMTKLKRDSQRAQALVDAYDYALKAHGRRDVREAYGRVSDAKVSAWDYCVGVCRENNGFGLTVVCANTYIFTAAFKYVDKASGEVCLCYITPSYNYSIEL